MIRKPINYNIFKTYLPAVAGILLLLWLSVPENISSADDAYTFSRLVRDRAMGEILLPRYPLYLPVGKSFYLFFHLLGFTPSAHAVLTGFSMICSAISIVLCFRLCYRTLDMSRVGAAGTALLLLFSWGFWRYSVEAELYTPSICCLLVYIFLLLRIRQKPAWGRDWWFAVLTGIFTILLYKPNFIPVLVCLPWLLSGKTIRRPLGFIITLGAGVVISYGLLGQLSEPYGFSDYLFGGSARTQGNPLASLFVLLGNQLSFLWIFSVQTLREVVFDIWPNKVLSEEMYLQNALAVPAWILVGLMMLTLGYALFLLIRNRAGFRRLVSIPLGRLLVPWIVLYAGMLLYYDPSSSEPWIMLQLPLLLIAGYVLFEGSADALRRVMVLPLVLLVFVINLAGGMLLIADETYDYIHLRAQGLPGQLTENDVIMTFGPKTMEAYLSYNFPARVVNLEENMQYGIELLQAGPTKGRIYVLGDVLQPEPAIRYRMDGQTEKPMNVILEKYELDTLFQQHQFSTFELREKFK